jgi:hypothetical protein
MTRQQYAQLPLSRPPNHPQHPSHQQQSQLAQQQQRQQAAIAGGYEKQPSGGGGEYSAQIDYEKQLRAQYEKPRNDNNYRDFSAKPSSSTKTFTLHTETSAKRIKLSWKLPTLPSLNNSH